MNLPTLLLACIKNNSQGCTGYDLTKKLTKELFFIWSASHQQVYRELNKLEEKRFIAGVVEPQDGKPDRKIYSITAKGELQLMAAGAECLTLPTIRDALSAKLFAADSVNDVVATDWCLVRQLDQCHQRLSELDRHKARTELSPYQTLLLDRQVHLLNAEIEWLTLAQATADA